MTESTTIDRSAFVGTAMSLHTAGFKPEGSYLVEVLGAKPDVFEGTNDAGEHFVSHRINFTLRAIKQATYTPDGTGKGIYSGEVTLDTPITFFKKVNIATKGLQFLRTAYNAVTGTLPTGRPDYLAMAEELRGSRFWINSFWIQDKTTGAWSEQIKNVVRSQQEGPLSSIVLRKDESGSDED